VASRGRGAKVKGSNFERKIAKLLSNWYFGIPDRLKRTPLSGGFSKNYKGDLFEDVSVKISDDPVKNSTRHFPFNVECKHQEVPLDIPALLSDKSVFWQFWNQTTTEFANTPDSGKIPLLVFTKNNVRPMVALPAILLKAGPLVPQKFIEIKGVAILFLEDFLQLPKTQFSFVDNNTNRMI